MGSWPKSARILMGRSIYSVGSVEFLDSRILTGKGGLFTIIITFTVEYPSAPPHCRFEPAIFHPNIFESGTVCLSLLKQEKHWKPSISIRQILLGIQELLHNPNIKDPANKKANNLFKSNKTKYYEEIKRQARKYSEENVMKELLGIE